MVGYVIRPSSTTELIFLVRKELVQTGRLMGRVALELRKQAVVHDKDTLNTIVSRRTELERRPFARMKGGLGGKYSAKLYCVVTQWMSVWTRVLSSGWSVKWPGKCAGVSSPEDELWEVGGERHRGLVSGDECDHAEISPHNWNHQLRAPAGPRCADYEGTRRET